MNVTPPISRRHPRAPRQASGIGSSARHLGIERWCEHLGQGYRRDLATHSSHRGGGPVTGHRRTDWRCQGIHPGCAGSAVEANRPARARQRLFRLGGSISHSRPDRISKRHLVSEIQQRGILAMRKRPRLGIDLFDVGNVNDPHAGGHRRLDTMIGILHGNGILW